MTGYMRAAFVMAKRNEAEDGSVTELSGTAAGVGGKFGGLSPLSFAKGGTGLFRPLVA
jgi:hypothetical protein